MGGFGRETYVTLTPLMPTHPSLPFLFSHEGGTVLGVKALDNSYSEGATFGTVLVKSGVQCLGFFSFLLKKEKIQRSIEVLQLGQMEQTASYPYALTHMHEPFCSKVV